MNNFKLDTNPKIESGFKIPDSYFDGFSEKVMQQLPKEEPKVVSFYSRNIRWIYSAAAIIVLSLSIPIVNQFQNNSEEALNSEIENYLSYHSTLSDDDLVELMDNEDIAKINIDATIEDKALEETLSNTNNIEEYITN